MEYSWILIVSALVIGVILLMMVVVIGGSFFFNQNQPDKFLYLLKKSNDKLQCNLVTKDESAIFLIRESAGGLDSILQKSSPNSYTYVYLYALPELPIQVNEGQCFYIYIVKSEGKLTDIGTNGNTAKLEECIALFKQYITQDLSAESKSTLAGLWQKHLTEIKARVYATQSGSSLYRPILDRLMLCAPKLFAE